MKKLFVMLLAAGLLAACNDNGADEESTADSTGIPSTVSPSDTSTIPVDTLTRPADTTIKK